MRQLIASLVSALLLTAGIAHSDEPITFGWVTDTHITTTNTSEKGYNRTVALRDALDALAKKNVEFIFHGGDTVETPGKETQLQAYDSLVSGVAHLYPIAGNHDLGNAPDEKSIARWLSHGYGRGPANREYYGFVHKGVAFYVLDTSVCESTAPGMQARAQAQLADMDDFFTSNSAAPTRILCGHAPVFLKTDDEPNDYFNIKMPYRQKVLDLMKKHNVHIYLSGHRHLQAQPQDKSGITVYSQKGLSFQIEKDKRFGYYVFHLADGKVEREFFPLGEPGE